MKQSGIWGFIQKKPASSSTTEPQLTAFRPSLASPKPSTPKRKVSEIADSSETAATPSKKMKYEIEKRERNFVYDWLNTFGWLRHENGVMFCKVCREFQHLLNKTDNVFIHGSNRFRKDPIDKHEKTKDHAICSSAARAKTEPTPIAVLKDRLDRKQVYKYQAFFNTAYLIAKRNFSFHDFEFLLKLQNKNGLQLGENYQNIQGAKTFIESIAHELRQHTINSLQKCRFFSLMADGSTDRSVAEQESVFVRYVVGGEPVSKFIASQEVKDARAAGVLDAIDTALSVVSGVSIKTQAEKLININLDGASVNMGIYNGVAARVRNRNGQHVTVTHCINHGLELSVLDTRI